ncbi:mitochondrial 39-S ribosomal protein L47 (MRP-L47)-domain-containing protein [Amylostereum chailletii]|nr:mitochondrial 39-S ribosomal protein L47 (MRP-L47)-domain-containing protein [Amylostereum chailletii]
MFTALRSRSTQLLTAAARARNYSTALENLPAGTNDHRVPGALRPHLGIQVNPNHGLWNFFRQRTNSEGETKHVAMEDADGLQRKSGRSWSAAELRRKSFRDLHTLWYVLVRERNLIATQGEEIRRVTGATSGHSGTSISLRAIQCRKSMARIKYVINERRLAYEGAMKIFARKQRTAERKAQWAALEAKRITKEAERARPVEHEPSEAAKLAAGSFIQSS